MKENSCLDSLVKMDHLMKWGHRLSSSMSQKDVGRSIAIPLIRLFGTGCTLETFVLASVKVCAQCAVSYR